jgi:hypothetical protein
MTLKLLIILAVLMPIVLSKDFSAAFAADSPGISEEKPKNSSPKIVYAKKTQLDFDGAQIQGEIQNPGEFYFQHRPEEKFDSLVKRRKNFHREMMRDVVFSK